MDDGRASGLSQLGEVLKAVRRRAALVAVIVAAAGIAAAVLTLSRPEEYRATSEVWISQTDPVNALLTRTDPAPVDAERDFNTRVELIKQPAVAERVRRELGLKTSADDLLGSVTTQVRGTSDIVGIEAVAATPRGASRLANAFARQFVLEREAAVRATIVRAADRAARGLEALSEVERQDAIGRELARRVRTLQVEAGLQTTGIEVVSLARPPSAASASHALLLTALAVVLAAMIAVALAVILDVVDRRIADETDLEPFGLRLLAAVPTARPGSGMDDPAVREALSAVATTLRPPTGRDDVGAVLMTPVGTGDDGRGSLCLGVARALAESGVSAIALEADLRQPAFAERLNLPDGPGLADVVAGRADLDDLIVEIDARTLRRQAEDDVGGDPSFAVVPAGGVPPNPVALLSSPMMRRVLKRLRSMADVVVIDSPPVGSAPDAVTLAGLVDGVVLVVRRGHTRRDTLARAVRVLQPIPAPLLGVVLTNAPRPEHPRRETAPTVSRAAG